MSKRSRDSLVDDKHSERSVILSDRADRLLIHPRTPSRKPHAPMPVNVLNADVAIGTGYNFRVVGFPRYAEEAVLDKAKSSLEAMPAEIRPSDCFVEYSKEATISNLRHRITQSPTVDHSAISPRFFEAFDQSLHGTASAESLVAMFLAHPRAFKSLEIAKQSSLSPIYGTNRVRWTQKLNKLW